MTTPIDWPAELDAWEAALADGRDVTEHEEGERRMTLDVVEQANARLAIRREAWADAIKLLRNRANLHRAWPITGWDNAADFLDANWPVLSTDGCPTTQVSSPNTDESKPATSPALNAPVRSAERAALDEAVRRLTSLRNLLLVRDYPGLRLEHQEIESALRVIRTLVPGSAQ